MDPIETEIVVVGGGPGGYTAAFYAADRGKKVILVDREERLGGVCLNRGCIPSKTLLHASQLLSEARESKHRGIDFPEPVIDLDKMRGWKNSILEKLSGGVMALAKRRGVEVVRGRGYFEDSDTLRVETEKGQSFIKYQKAIIAVGSLPALPAAFDLGNPRIMTSTEALEIAEIPQKLLIVGGGYIGMELGTVYATLGSRVTVAESLPMLLAGVDPDLARPVVKFAEKTFVEIRLCVKVKKMATHGAKIKVTMEIENQEEEEEYDRVLVSIGRRPNCADLGLENTKVQTDDRGFIKVNAKQETNDSKICAVGDIVGGLLLAHKASREARIAVDNILGEENAFEHIVIPAVVFTNPEVTWCGLTEEEARHRDIPVEVSRFSWAASGRALSFDRTDGLTKLVVEPGTERILGVGVVGHGASELISEGVLAIEMGATVRDLAECIHPHPTLSETFMECAEAFYGVATHKAPTKRNAS
jgi:dihydrolipoyl dehydrogenase